jgi:hypothetical protein
MISQIICVVGRKRSGKDTFFANYATYHFSPNIAIEQISFADNIKIVASTLFHLPLPYFYDDDKKEDSIKLEWSSDNLNITPREMCTTLGSFCRNTYGKNIWIDLAFDSFKSRMVSENRKIIGVVTDARYPNEVEYILKQYPGRVHVVYIEADKRLGPMPEDAHESEKSVYLIKEQFKDIITIIDNNKSEWEYTINIQNAIDNSVDL